MMLTVKQIELLFRETTQNLQTCSNRNTNFLLYFNLFFTDGDIINLLLNLL